MGMHLGARGYVEMSDISLLDQWRQGAPVVLVLHGPQHLVVDISTVRRKLLLPPLA
jgi:hypothetical protein